MEKTFVLSSDAGAHALWAFLKSNWRALAQAGKPLCVSVAEHKAKRSGAQNKRYWSLLNEIAGGAWVQGRQYNAEVWADFYKARLIGMEETPDGRQVGISTTTLSVAEFNAYMEQIEAHAVTELGVIFNGA